MSETAGEHDQGTTPVSDDSTTVSHDGVRVEKSIHWIDDETFRVQFDVTNTTGDAVHVDVKEQIPAVASLDDIGFHADYGWKYWYVEHDSQLAYRADLEPNEEHLTLYAVRSGGAHDPAIFLGEPELEVTPLAGGDTPPSTHSSDDDTDSPATDGSMFGVDTPSRENDPDPDAVQDEHDPSRSEPSSTAHQAAQNQDVNESNDLGSTDGGEDVVGGADEVDGADEVGGEDGTDGEDVVDGADEVGGEDGTDGEDVVDGADGGVGGEDENVDKNETDDGVTRHREPRDDSATEVDDTPHDSDATVSDQHSTDHLDAVGSSMAPGPTSSSTADARGRDDESKSLVAELARELAGGHPDAEAVSAIREHVGAPPVDRPSLDVRLQHVETELNQLTAYRSALEEFIDENGRGRDILGALQANHEEISETLTVVKSRLDAVDTRLSTVESHAEDVEALQATLTGLDDRLTALETAHEEADSRLDTTERQLDTATQALEDVESQVQTVATRHDSTVDQLGSHLDRLDETVETLASRQQRVAGIFDDLSTSLADDAASDPPAETMADGGHRSTN